MIASIAPQVVVGTAAILTAGAYLFQISSTQPHQLRASAPSQTIREKAKSAAAFVDSIGMNINLRYTTEGSSDLSYNRFYDLVLPRLQELGVRHVRDGGSNPKMFPRLRALGSVGIRTTFIMDPRFNITPQNAMQTIQPALSAIAAIEGPNEWDVNSTTMFYQGKTFPEGLRNYQADLYRVFKSNPSTRTIPVIAPSMAFPENARKLGSIIAFSDYANMHSYAGGNVPGQDIDSRWIPLTKAMTENRPMVVTETGYHNAVSDTKASQKAVSEQVSGKYVPRLFLEYFKRGIKRTFLYEFMDQRSKRDQESNFGIVRFDGTPKPAFNALRNLIRLLNDKPGSVVNGSMAYAFTGESQNLRHLLLQKSNGDFYLMLWLNPVSNDTFVTQRVTVNFATPIRQASTYLPHRSTNATASFSSPTRITVDVPDAPLVVKLTPNR